MNKPRVMRTLIFAFVATATLTAISNIRHLLHATALIKYAKIRHEQVDLLNVPKFVRIEASQQALLDQQIKTRKERMDQQVAPFGVQSSESDIAYLDHCNLSALDAEMFAILRDSILTRVAVKQQKDKGNNGGFGMKIRGTSHTARQLKVNEMDLVDEVSLQALEVYAQAMGVCDFARYQPTVVLSSNGSEMQSIRHRISQIPSTISSGSSETKMARLVFCISAFDDFPQLRKLVESIHLPHHLILIHLERRAPPDFAQQVYSLAHPQKGGFENVVVLQFGTIIYPSGSLTHVVMSIMQWVVVDLEDDFFPFDYFISMSASTFPLYSAQEMARYLYTDTKRVRLGAMYSPPASATSMKENSQLSLAISVTRGLGDKQRIFKDNNIDDLLQKINATISSSSTTLGNHRVPRDFSLKSNSGNTAAFDRATLVQLFSPKDDTTTTTSALAKQVLVSSKLGTFCCGEEHVWIQAMDILGKRDQAHELPGAVWQAWQCPSSEANARLVRPDPNNSICLRVEDRNGRRTIQGQHALEQELYQAKQRGNLFARKFHSSDSYWIEWIKSNLHNDQ